MFFITQHHFGIRNGGPHSRISWSQFQQHLCFERWLWDTKMVLGVRVSKLARGSPRASNI